MLLLMEKFIMYHYKPYPFHAMIFLVKEKKKLLVLNKKIKKKRISQNSKILSNHIGLMLVKFQGIKGTNYDNDNFKIY